MVQRIGGFRRKSRHKLQKNARERGKFSLTSFLQSFKNGDNVILNMEPSYQKGAYCLRFHGLIGTVKRQRGKCYEVSIQDGKKQKSLIVHPVHLKKV